MAPPPIPAAPKKAGCLKIGLIIVGCLFAAFIGLVALGWWLTPPEQKARLKAEREARDAAAASQQSDPPIDPEAQRQADEAAAKAKAEVSAKRKALQASQSSPSSPLPGDSLPAKNPKPSPPAETLTAKQQVEKQLRANADTIFSDVRECTAWENKTAGAWDIQINVHEKSPNAWMLQGHILKLAEICHPPGFKVATFTVGVSSVFTDGLGNSSEGSLLTAELRPGVASKINWKNTANIDFHKAFETTKVHRSFKEEWESVGR